MPCRDKIATYYTKNLQPIFKRGPQLLCLSCSRSIVYQQPLNFKRIISSKNPPSCSRTFPCNTSSCHHCSHIKTNNIVNKPRNCNFTIISRVTCTSSNFLYRLSCLLCSKSTYIREREYSIRQRMNGYKIDIRHNNNKPVVKHLNLCGQSVCHLQVLLLKPTRIRDNDKSKNKKSFTNSTALKKN